MKPPRGDLAHALAAEYVLGTLRGPARRRFATWVREDAALAAIVRRWEGGLVPLAERIPPVEPPARVWKAIEARIAERARPGRGLWSSVGFWRAFGLVSGGLASVLLAVFLGFTQAPRGEPIFVAMLDSADRVPHAMVSMSWPDTLRISMMKPMPHEGRDLELWVIPKEGAPRSLGVMRHTGRDIVIRISADDPRVQGAKALAVSLEPMGGSPTRQPTGPVILSGTIMPMAKAI